jgi:sirohydrochlorin ferrochelatase
MSLSPSPERLSVVVIGHGSRDDGATREFERLVADYARHRPDLDVSHGFVELAAPTLTDSLEAAARRAARVVALPLLLFAAGHVKNDLPLALVAARRDYPRVRFDVARPLGVHPLLTDLLFERAGE